ncbi:sensor histidine kinase [Georgenia muralis]
MRAPRRALTVRARILATVLSITALALLVAGGTAYLLQRDQVDDAIDESLARSVTEFRTFADADPVDPDTGRPYPDVKEFLRAAIGQEVPATNEAWLGFVGDRLELVSVVSAGGVDLTDDAVLIERLSSMAHEEKGATRTVTTPTSQYRLSIVPVSDENGATTGALAVVWDRSAQTSAVVDTFRRYVLVSVAALVLLAVVGWRLAGRLLNPLRRLRETAEQISDTDLSGRIDVQGDDDLSDLARTVNAMLARLEEAFLSQRRLLDDAGHELRTPITVIRGHLELMDPTDPEDAAATRELALAELDRMHRLTDDLVVLAKADQPDFVQPVRTSIGRLTDDTLDRARTLGPRRWRVDARLEADVEVDAQRLTQAWLQLAANAVKFSDEGSTVALGSALHEGRLLLWVRDEGVGVAPQERERIFQRFARARTPGPAREGSGLGLAIVSAITHAHGGQVRLDSEPGAGSVFVLDLPARGAVTGPPTEELPVPRGLGTGAVGGDGAAIRAGRGAAPSGRRTGRS